MQHCDLLTIWENVHRIPGWLTGLSLSDSDRDWLIDYDDNFILIGKDNKPELYPIQSISITYTPRPLDTQ